MHSTSLKHIRNLPVMKWRAARRPIIRNLQYAKCLIFIFLLIGNLGANDTPQSLVENPNILPHPLRVGEKITYNINVKRMPAAQRTDWIVKEELLNGEPVYHVQSKMKTRSLFRLYSFERQEETYLNPKTLLPVHFRNQLRDQKYRATVTIDFRGETAAYEKISRPKPKSPEKREIKELEIPVGTQDELSMLYFLRSKQLAVGNTYFFPVIAKGKVQEVILTVERREKVKNKKLGNVETLVLQTSTGGRFWFTDDARRLLVKAETKRGRWTAIATLVKIEFIN